MLLVVILIAWLSVSAVAVLLCAAASRADDATDQVTRERWTAARSLAPTDVPGDGAGRILAGRVPRATAPAGR